jgi:acetyl-CoA carboxylase biotin carboxyl carrier protein
MFVVVIATTKFVPYGQTNDMRVAEEDTMAIINVKTEITGNIWKIEAQVGQTLAEGDTIMILESMKMEIPVCATEDGVLIEIVAEEGATVTEGTVVARIEA